jgi:hypothetical protein
MLQRCKICAEENGKAGTGNADDELPACDPCTHAEQDLMSRMQVVERAPEGDYGEVRGFGGLS